MRRKVEVRQVQRRNELLIYGILSLGKMLHDTHSHKALGKRVEIRADIIYE